MYVCARIMAATPMLTIDGELDEHGRGLVRLQRLT